jgi:hypothetical protein
LIVGVGPNPQLRIVRKAVVIHVEGVAVVRA